MAVNLQVKPHLRANHDPELIVGHSGELDARDLTRRTRSHNNVSAQREETR